MQWRNFNVKFYWCLAHDAIAQCQCVRVRNRIPSSIASNIQPVRQPCHTYGRFGSARASESNIYVLHFTAIEWDREFGKHNYNTFAATMPLLSSPHVYVRACIVAHSMILEFSILFFASSMRYVGMCVCARRPRIYQRCWCVLFFFIVFPFVSPLDY